MRLGGQRIVRGVAVALVTNYLPAYRIPLYTLLAERLGVEVYCFGGEGHYVPEAMRDLDRQLESAPFPAHRLERQRDAAELAAGHDAVIASTAGRVALPSAYRGARRAGRPFLLWASLWRHPRTAAHLLSFPLMRSIYRHADAVITYGPHVSRYVAAIAAATTASSSRRRRSSRRSSRAPSREQEIEQWRDEAGLGQGPLVLFAGRLVADKGVDVLARAWRRLGDRAAQASAWSATARWRAIRRSPAFPASPSPGGSTASACRLPTRRRTRSSCRRSRRAGSWSRGGSSATRR